MPTTISSCRRRNRFDDALSEAAILRDCSLSDLMIQICGNAAADANSTNTLAILHNGYGAFSDQEAAGTQSDYAVCKQGPDLPTLLQLGSRGAESRCSNRLGLGDLGSYPQRIVHAEGARKPARGVDHDYRGLDAKLYCFGFALLQASLCSFKCQVTHKPPEKQ